MLRTMMLVLVLMVMTMMMVLMVMVAGESRFSLVFSTTLGILLLQVQILRLLIVLSSTRLQDARSSGEWG